jgi:hypothetical protein
MMQNVVCTIASGTACVEIANVAFDHPEARGTLERRGEYLIEVRRMTGGEIIQADDVLTERQELLEEIGAYKTRDSGNDPGFGIGQQVLSKTSVGCGVHEFTV